MKLLFSSPGPIFPSLARALALATLLTMPAGLCAQDSSSSSSGGSPAITQRGTKPLGPRPAVEAAGSGTSLEFNEPLFFIAAALNVCGYDTGLEHSLPVRKEVRADLDQALASSSDAQNSRDRMCRYILQHRLVDGVQNTSQYVYLALYTSPPPELTTTATEGEMIPAAVDVINLLPLLRAFSEATQLHLIYLKHRPEYEALQAQVHDPLTKMILDTNTYLKLPVSNYDGRRFEVILEPLLAPAQTNSLLYDVNYFVVTSPENGTPPQVNLNDVRHTYLHYQIEPMMYAKTSTLDNFLPLLRHEQIAPVPLEYKTNITAFLTECLIKAVEVHLMDTGLVKPTRPDTRDLRASADYNNAMNAYLRQTEGTRRAAVDHDMRQGWAVTQYFYEETNGMVHNGTPLQEGIGPMLFGMEVERERDHESKIVFDAVSDADVVKRAPAHTKTQMEIAEEKLLVNPTVAEQIAEQVLADPKGDHGSAEYMLGRIALLHGDPQGAVDHFGNAVRISRDLRTLAWSHIYLGRLYDTEPDRARAIQEYMAAVQVRDGKSDTLDAAQAGLRKPFSGAKHAPIRPTSSAVDANGDPLDPSGKAEKDSYRPDPTAK